MTEAANVSKKHSKKCMPRPLQGNKHRSTRPSPRCAKAFASFQECSIQCDERDRKAEDFKIELSHMVIVRVGQLTKPGHSAHHPPTKFNERNGDFATMNIESTQLRVTSVAGDCSISTVNVGST